MNILHCIPGQDVQLLQQTQAFDLFARKTPGIENCVLTEKSAEPLLRGCEGIEHIYSRKTLRSGTGKAFRRIVSEKSVDIVHIHSFADIFSWRVCRMAKAMRIPVVFSPHNRMTPWHLDSCTPLARYSRLLIAHILLRPAFTAILTESVQEEKYMQKLSAKHLEKSNRLSVISRLKDFGDGTDDAPRFYGGYAALYRKVIDSNPFWLMSEEDRHAENALLTVGAIQQSGNSTDSVYLPIEDIRAEAEALSAEHWRRIQLHSSDQGILQAVTEAYRTLTGSNETLDTASVDRYSVVKRDKEMDTAVPYIRKAKMHQIAEDYSEYAKERQLCVMLLNVKHLLAVGELSRKHLADLYTAVRFNDYNEFVMEEILSDAGILGFGSKIFSILADTMFLEPGYVPVTLTDKERTKKIRKKLFKSKLL